MTGEKNILDDIILHKRNEIAFRKERTGTAALEKSALFQRKSLSLREFLLDAGRTGIIAEFKRKSPSKGIINGQADVQEVTRAYADLGASAISVLTDEKFFGGCNEDLTKARINEVPLLRKDFVVDEYQLVEAKSIGADAVLLIAACMSPARARQLAAVARSLDLEVLLEIHDEPELGHICDEIDLVGVNNRDLKTFTVDINRSVELIRQVPPGKICIAESGISEVETIRYLRKLGFKGFLIGENFMKAPQPAIAFASFVKLLKPELNESEGLRNDAARSGKETR